jgi:hypothetical protein
MKTTRLLGAALLATSAFLGACDDDDDDITEPTNAATVRFVNLTGQNIDIGTNGTFATGNSNLGFGIGSQCVAVNPASAGLTFRQNGQATNFTPTGFNASSLTAGGDYVVVLRNATGGGYQATTFTDTYTGASSTMGGVRVINATTGTTNYGLYVGTAGTTRPTTATDATFGAGEFTTFTPVATGNGQVWFTTGAGAALTNAFTTNAFPVASNGYQTIIVGDAATAGGDLRFARIAGCT